MPQFCVNNFSIIKYVFFSIPECLAPPSYEEVVGIHYPQYQVQPITQPITTAMAQSSSNVNVTNSVNVTESPSTVITVTSEARTTSVQVAASWDNEPNLVKPNVLN